MLPPANTDERFYTPRAQAPLSNRSHTSTFVTPRSYRGELHSARSLSSNEFDTSRSIHSARVGAGATFSRADQRYQHDIDLEPGVALNTQIVGDLFSLARHGKADEVNKILQMGVPVDTRDSNGNTILCIGCQNNCKRIVKLALRYGADMNAMNLNGNTALHFCYRYGFRETLGAYLISKGANQNIRNAEGLLPRQEGRVLVTSTSYFARS